MHDARWYEGPLYRALNPVYGREPQSGLGAQRYGGRFNPKGVPALYTSLDPATALREAQQVGSLQPTVLVSYRARIGPVFVARDATTLADYGMSTVDLADPAWRMAMLEGRSAQTQDLGRALISKRFAGLMVRSFAKGASDASLKLVLWRWTTGGCTLDVVDDEDQLGRM